MTKTVPNHTLPPKPKSVIVKLSSIPEKFLEKGVKASQGKSVGCVYPYIETKELLDGSNVFYPRVIGDAFGVSRTVASLLISETLRERPAEKKEQALTNSRLVPKINHEVSKPSPFKVLRDGLICSLVKRGINLFLGE